MKEKESEPRMYYLNIYLVIYSICYKFVLAFQFGDPLFGPPQRAHPSIYIYAYESERFICFLLPLNHSSPPHHPLQLPLRLHVVEAKDKTISVASAFPGLQEGDIVSSGSLPLKMDAFHFDEIVKVTKVDADGKKYDKVSRIEAESNGGETSMQLDINSELYPMKRKELYRMVISTTLNMDGSAVTSYPPEGKSLADKFEYIVHGLVYKVSMDASGPAKKVVVYVSFGGLQLMLKSDPLKVHKFKLDQKLFLLLRKMVK